MSAPKVSLKNFDYVDVASSADKKLAATNIFCDLGYFSGNTIKLLSLQQVLAKCYNPPLKGRKMGTLMRNLLNFAVYDNAEKSRVFTRIYQEYPQTWSNNEIYYYHERYLYDQWLVSATTVLKALDAIEQMFGKDHVFSLKNIDNLAVDLLGFICEYEIKDHISVCQNFEAVCKSSTKIIKYTARRNGEEPIDISEDESESDLNENGNNNTSSNKKKKRTRDEHEIIKKEKVTPKLQKALLFIDKWECNLHVLRHTTNAVLSEIDQFRTISEISTSDVLQNSIAASIPESSLSWLQRFNSKFDVLQKIHEEFTESEAVNEYDQMELKK